MSDGLLPHRVNIRKAVTRSARYSGTVGPDQIQWEGGLLAPLEAESDTESGLPPQAGTYAAVVVEFGADDQQQQYAQVSLEADVLLECQRCLQPVQRHLSSSSRLGLVRTDEEALQLPAGYEPLLAIDEVDLWQVAGEELALALPVVAYHDSKDCAPLLRSSVDSKEENNGDVGDQRDGPFSALSALLRGGDESNEE